jgi:hypothetical protein
MPSVSTRLPNAAADFGDAVFFVAEGLVPEELPVEPVVEVDGVVAVLLVVLVVLVVVVVGAVVGVVPDPPSEDPPDPPAAAAGPAASAKNRMEVAVRRRQPVTASEYDKPTLSLSCAYGVSCRARAERGRATPLFCVAIRPKSRYRDSYNWFPRSGSTWPNRTRLGVLAGSITLRQHR